MIELLKSPHKAEQLRQTGVAIGAYEDDCVEAMMADFLLANGVIVPPCKVGQEVYVADKGGMKEATVAEIYLGKGDDSTIFLSFDCDDNCENCPFNSWTQEYSGEYSCAGEWGCWDVHTDDFGKTVFLTREEAEKALAERSGK